MVFFPTGRRSSQRRMLDEADIVVKIMKDVNTSLQGWTEGRPERVTIRPEFQINVVILIELGRKNLKLCKSARPILIYMLCYLLYSCPYICAPARS